ncbi:putative glutathione S-transferase 8 [Hypsibius exemplaris]|uniref:glutathione transferase n=1 Tax=Hypsibius exemplaris TaxID=2072580 RepID=A0A1W0WDE4_HYPEX|nr:putative glutathione S-transferase 8 [Hypsibius exemplaris]
MAPVYKLHYFNLRTRGEVIRWTLSLAGQEFEDHRVEFPDWPALKPTTPTGQLPYLEVDGKALDQSVTIARFVAREHGLAGKNNWESAQVDSLVDYLRDAAKGFEAYTTAFFTRDPKIEEVKTEFTTKSVVPFLEGLERKLQSNDSGKGYFVGTTPTWGDLAAAHFLDEVVRLNPDALAKTPLLKAHNQRVHELKGIKEWLAKRPETPL